VETVDRLLPEVGAAGLAATACVRVLAAGEEVVGAGFLVGPDLVAYRVHMSWPAPRDRMRTQRPPDYRDDRRFSDRAGRSPQNGPPRCTGGCLFGPTAPGMWPSYV